MSSTMVVDGSVSDGTGPAPETDNAIRGRRISETTTAVDDSLSVGKRVGAKSKEHPIGFQVLYQPTVSDLDDVTADVVFVHGLAGDALETWTCKSPRTFLQKLQPCAPPPTKTCWPRDILPEEQPDIRVLTYGYRVPISNNPFFSTKVVASNLEEDANTFLQQLIDFRSKTHTEYRPIIFIGHSLGGLVIERALARCSTVKEDRYDEQRILSCTEAVTAIGVPHRGSKHATRVLRIAWLLSPFTGLNTGVLQTLKVQETVSFHWQGDYLAAIAERWRLEKPITLAYISENLGFTYLGRIVDGASATLTTEFQARSSGVDGNHLTMVKFCSKDDPRFLAIWEPLSRLIKAIRDGTSRAIRNEDNYYKRDLFPGDMLNPGRSFIGRSDLLKEMDRLFESKEGKWPEQDQPYVFALVGIGGVGKSQLALKWAEIQRKKAEFANVFLFDASSASSLESSIRSACHKLRKDRSAIEGASWVPTKAMDDGRRGEFVREYLEGTRRRWLVILDNCDAAEDFSIRKAIPKGRTGCVIITSRITKADVLGMPAMIKVEPMNLEEAVELLHDRLVVHPVGKKFEAPWVQSDAETIVDLLGYLPLAIEVAAAYIGNESSNTNLNTFIDTFKRETDAIYEENLYSLVYRQVAKEGNVVSLSIRATFGLQLKNLKKRDSQPGAEEYRKKAWGFLEVAGFLDRNRLDATFFDNTQTALYCTDNNKWVKECLKAGVINRAFNHIEANSLATLNPVKPEGGTTPVLQLRLHPAISQSIRMRPLSFEDGRKLFRRAARMISFHLRRCDHDDVMSCNHGLTNSMAQHIQALIRNDKDFNAVLDKGETKFPENRLGSGNLLAATIRFAGFMQDMGYPAAAETLYNLAIDRNPTSKTDPGPKSIHLIDANEGLAIVHLWKGDLEKAHELCEKCVEDNEDHEARGKNHLTTLRTYHNLGEIQCARKEFKAAVKVFKKAWKAALAHDNEHGLGAVDKDGKKLEWSEDAIREQEALGNAYRCKGKLEKAYKKVDQVLEYLDNNEKKKDSDLRYSTHESMALILKAMATPKAQEISEAQETPDAQEKPDPRETLKKSLDHYNIAIDGYIKTVGESQHGTLGAMEGRADAMRRLGDFVGARTELEHILNLRREVNGPESEHFKRVERALKLVPKDQPGDMGRFDELEEYSFPWPRPVYAADDPSEDEADTKDDWTFSKESSS